MSIPQFFRLIPVCHTLCVSQYTLRPHNNICYRYTPVCLFFSCFLSSFLPATLYNTSFIYSRQMQLLDDVSPSERSCQGEGMVSPHLIYVSKKPFDTYRRKLTIAVIMEIPSIYQDLLGKNQVCLNSHYSLVK